MGIILTILDVCRSTSPEVACAVGYFDLQGLLRGDADNIFPIDRDGTHRVGAVAQGAEFQRLDLARDCIAVDQQHYIGLGGHGRRWRRQEQCNREDKTVKFHDS
jgi:hypothetical protein